MTDYIYNHIEGIIAKGKAEELFLSLDVFKQALSITNEKMNELKETVPYLFEILGMRNLSAFVGEMFVRNLVLSSNGALVKNPHQDGYPDILTMTDEGKSLWKSLSDNHQDKAPFSDFETGGIEVKATVGSLPTPAWFRKNGLTKPEIGDERIEYVKGYDWKSHHRKTNNLIGIYWDFVEEKPVVCGLFFSGDLDEIDWGKIVQPKPGGGRTTSVSIMTRDGIYKMYQNWIAVIDDQHYIDFFNHYNKANLIVAP